VEAVMIVDSNNQPMPPARCRWRGSLSVVTTSGLVGISFVFWSN
jgi:hypothetical protein